MMHSSLLQQLSAESAALVASHTPHVVAVAASPRRSLSAIRWRGDYLVSAAEGLAGADRVRVRTASGGESSELSEGEVLAADPSTDVAIIRWSRASSTDSPSPVIRSDPVQLGESVVIIGCDWRGPLARWGSISVSGAAWRSRRGGSIDRRIEISSPFDERLEGALVVDVAGRIAAMAVPGPAGRTLGIPSASIERVLVTVEKHGHLPRPYLGLRLQRLWIDAATAARFGRSSARMPVVAGVEVDSPAATAGLEPGDLIETVDGQEVDGIDALRQVLSQSDTGRTVTLGLRRGGVTQVRTLTLAERPRPS